MSREGRNPLCGEHHDLVRTHSSPCWAHVPTKAVDLEAKYTQDQRHCCSTSVGPQTPAESECPESDLHQENP